MLCISSCFRMARAMGPFASLFIAITFAHPAVGQDKNATPDSPVVPVAVTNGEPASSETAAPQSLSELQDKPGYQAELKLRTDVFDAAKAKLVSAISSQMDVMVRFRNQEADSEADRTRFRAARAEVRQSMNDLYDASLNLCRISNDNEAAQYVVTMVKHRVENGIYDLETSEGAARMIDGGLEELYLYLAAARSAVVSGQFDMAKKIYSALKEEHRKDIDHRFFFTLDKLKEDYEKEETIRKQEAEADDLPRVLLKTSEGDVVLELFLNQAPSTVSHFIALVEEGYYDGVDFHQVVPDAIALTGDPTGLGDGHCGKFLLDENERPDARAGLRGTLVMAKMPNPAEPGSYFKNSASSQFAILYTPSPGIRHAQTIFGRVIEGMENLCRVRLVDPSKEKKKGEIVLPSDRIIEATMIRRPPTLPEPKYFDPAAAVRAKGHQGHDH